VAKNSKSKPQTPKANTLLFSFLANYYTNHPLIYSFFWPPKGIPSTLKHQWVFIGQVQGGRSQKYLKQTLEPLCLLANQPDVPRYRSISMLCRLGRKVFFFTKLLRYRGADFGMTPRQKSVFLVVLPVSLNLRYRGAFARHFRLFFTQLRHKSVFLHKSASVPGLGLGRALRHALCVSLASALGSIEAALGSIEAALRHSSLSFTLLRSLASVPELEPRHATSVQLQRLLLAS
jgi:hypothetical protein